MANGAERAAGGFPAHTIYIWPSAELVARSWEWPEAWHAAYEQAAWQLAGLVATCVLGGLPVTQVRATRRLRAGSVSFRVKCRGTGIFIAILDFEGPHAPGPNGGTRQQPHPADGLVLGLRGSGKSFTVVTFYGPLPPVPADTMRGSWRSIKPVGMGENGIHDFHSRRATAIILAMPVGFRTALSNGMRKKPCWRRDLASILQLAGRETENSYYILLSHNESLSICRSRYGRSVRRELPRFASQDLESTAPVLPPLRRLPFDCGAGRGRHSSGDPGLRLQ